MIGPAGDAAPEPDRPSLPIGVALATIGVEIGWWLESARRLEAAGYADLWAWDHFVSRGDRRTPVLEQWVTLALAAGATRRIGLGSFVANVMNRHPAVLARMAGTLQAAAGGRLTLGIGVGGHPAEHEAYGIPFPPVAQRAARLESAVAVIRALWTGGPVTRDDPFYPLREAHAHPVPVPLPRIVVGGETTAGARLAARIGDGWTAFDRTFERDLPAYLDALAEAGRSRHDQRLIVAFEAGRAGQDALAGSPWTADPGATGERWRAAGADAAIVTARTTVDVDALVEAAGRR